MQRRKREEGWTVFETLDDEQATSWWTEEKKETNERKEEVEERESCRECSEDFLELITPTIINVA